MKKALLLVLILFSLKCFAFDATIVYVDANGNTHNEFETSGMTFSPCQSLKFRVVINNPPANYTLCNVVWYDNGFVSYGTTTTNEITIPISKSGQIIICDVTYGSGNNCANPATATANGFHVNSLYEVGLTTPTAQSAVVAGCTNPVTFTSNLVNDASHTVPASGTYSLQWLLPTGWTNTPQAFTTTVTPDANSTGSVSLKLTLNACPYSATSGPYNVVRTAATPSFAASNNYYVCSVPLTRNYSINALCGAQSYTYTLTNTPYAKFSNNTQSITTTSTSVPITFTVLGIQAILKVQANYAGGATSAIISHDIISGAPQLYGYYTVSGTQYPLAFNPDTQSDYNQICKGPNATVTLQTKPGTNVTWSLVSSSTGVLNWSQTGSNMTFYFYNINQWGLFKAVQSNACGTLTNTFGFKAKDCTGGGGGCFAYTITPNPAHGKVNIIKPNVPPPCGFAPGGSNSLSSYNIKRVNMYDNVGMLKLSQTVGANAQTSIDISRLHSGYYMVEIIGDNYTEKQKILIK